MSVLNQIVYIRPAQSVAADFLEKISGEGFSYVVLTPENDYIGRMSQTQPAAILINPGFESAMLNEIVPLMKERFPYVPIVLVTNGPITSSQDVPVHMPLDGVCDMGMPSAQIAVTLRGIIRSAFMIQELVYSNRRLSDISITDSLTGLYNRGHMMNRLSLEWKRAERNHETLSCVMIDVDHFKSINDNYGHKFGDGILKAMSARIKSLTRETDIFGRYGGEEFLLVLPNTNLDGASFLAEKLRAGLEEKKFQQDCFSLLVTASFGVASTENPEVITADHLLQLSDRALYQAKESGRNRVCVSGRTERDHYQATQRTESETAAQRQKVLVLSSSLVKCKFIDTLRCSDVYEPVFYGKEDDFLRAFKEDPPHMLLFDHVWEGASDVVSLCHRIKQQTQDLFVPVVALLKDADELTRERIVKAGADDVIMPHLTTEAFMAHLELISRLKNLHDRLRSTDKNLRMARESLIKAERLNALGEMATGIAHDFNNILSAILGRTQLLRQKVADASIVKSLEVIEKAANDGAATIRRIQEFSRSTATGAAYQQLDLAQVVKDCIQLTRTLWKDQADMKGIRYTFHTNFSSPLWVHGSASDLREVIINIIMNALDAMPKGGSLRFDGLVSSENAVLTIADTGAGMSEEVAKRVFDPFFSTKKGEGSGLGLSVAYGIIMRHNGRIECVSEEGKGSTFRIQLPFVATDAMPSAKTDTPSVTRQGMPSPLNILVVDDEESVREVFKDIFMQDGHTVFTAASGREALAIMDKEKIDLLFTDLSMPEMPGWEVARQAKEIFPEATVVLTSGWGKDFNQEQIARHGVDLVLPKPVPFDTLQALARQVSEGKPISLSI